MYTSCNALRVKHVLAQSYQKPPFLWTKMCNGRMQEVVSPEAKSKASQCTRVCILHISRSRDRLAAITANLDLLLIFRIFVRWHADAQRTQDILDRDDADAVFAR